MDTRISFPISSRMTVIVSIDTLKDVIEKIDAGEDANLPDGISCVVKDIRKKMRDYSRRNEASFNTDLDTYVDILKDDADSRLRKSFGRKEINVDDFIAWCWEHNAGHWPDGTKITDD